MQFHPTSHDAMRGDEIYNFAHSDVVWIIYPLLHCTPSRCLKLTSTESLVFLHRRLKMNFNSTSNEEMQGNMTDSDQVYMSNIVGLVKIYNIAHINLI